LAVANHIGALAEVRHGSRFSPEFEMLIDCCTGPRPSTLPGALASSIDWELLLDSAEHHRLVPALFLALASQSRIAIPRAIRDRARLHGWRSLQFTTELRRISRHLEERRIPFLAYKGPVLGQLLYRDPTARQFGDLDLLVVPSDVSRAKSALLELGYQLKLQLPARHEKSYLGSGYEYAFCLNSERPTVELQWRIAPMFYSVDFDLDAFFNRSIEIDLDGMGLRTLCHEDLMLALCVHAAKHEWSQLGMTRDIMRLASLDLDWKWITEEASRLGIFKILQVSFSIGRKILGRDMPRPVPISDSGHSVHELATSVVNHLACNREPNTDSVSYFMAQLRTRERRRDRIRFLWRLATTPGVGEWDTLKNSTSWSGFYRLVRVARLLKRIVAQMRMLTQTQP